MHICCIPRSWYKPPSESFTWASWTSSLKHLEKFSMRFDGANSDFSSHLLGKNGASSFLLLSSLELSDTQVNEP